MLVALVLLGLYGLLIVGVAGGVYSLAAHTVARRFGRPHLVVLWLAASIGLAAIGTRKLPPARRTGAEVHHINVPGLFAYLLAWLLVIFAVPTFVAWSRARSPDVHASPSGAAIAGAGWTIFGLLLAIGLAVMLKNVGLLPTAVR